MLFHPVGNAQGSAPTLPLLLSLTALLTSGAALLVATGGRGGGVQRESEPLKRMLPGKDYVQLEQLAIYRSNIVDGAVGTLELQDGAVTGSKLARGAVTMDSISQDALASLATGSIIAGEVDESGEVVRGSGFRATRSSSGEYTLAFQPVLAAVPVVVVSAQSYGACYVPSQHVSATEVRVKCMSELLTSSPVPTSTRFSFIASPSL